MNFERTINLILTEVEYKNLLEAKKIIFKILEGMNPNERISSFYIGDMEDLNDYMVNFYKLFTEEKQGDKTIFKAKVDSF